MASNKETALATIKAENAKALGDIEDAVEAAKAAVGEIDKAFAVLKDTADRLTVVDQDTLTVKQAATNGAAPMLKHTLTNIEQAIARLTAGK